MRSAKPVAVRPIGLVSRAGQSADPSTWTNHVGPISVFDGKADYDIDWKTLDEAGASGERVRQRRRLARLHRQILADRACARRRSAMTADFRHSPSGGYQADYALSPDRSSRRARR